MNLNNEHQQDILQIKQMMERSSRFISLSGLSGIAAGTCALIGAYFAHHTLATGKDTLVDLDDTIYSSTNGHFLLSSLLDNKLIIIAIITFLGALLSSILFTWLRSKKTNVPLWGSTSKRLMVNVFIPLITGGIFLIKLIENGNIGLIAPGCLVFYGLALVNAAKYTLGEIKYLGYFQIVLGIINLWCVGKGLYFWATGFGVLHIVYGIIMWIKYERE